MFSFVAFLALYFDFGTTKTPRETGIGLQVVSTLL